MRSTLFALVETVMFTAAACGQLPAAGTWPATPVPGALPQAAAIPPAEYFAGPWSKELLTAEQIERLVGPIALYPDPLLAQVLPASTSPLDVVKAARLVRAGADESAIAAADLDVSVQALARSPEVITMMDEHLEWTERLGQAFIEQPDEVMLAVQRLRAIARQYGNLATTAQQEVIFDQEAIRILPVTEYVYVPTYAPTLVYSRPCPYPYTYTTFSSCSWVGPWYDLDCDWHRRVLCRRDGWSWRDYCQHRRTWSDLTVRINSFDDDCDRPVRDWRREPRRRVLGGRDGSDGRAGWDRDWRSEDDRSEGDWRDRNDRPDRDDRPVRHAPRSTPRAAEPNPPVIVAPPPARPRETLTPRPNTPRAAERVDRPDPSPRRTSVAPSPADDSRPRLAAKDPSAATDPKPRAAVAPPPKPAAEPAVKPKAAAEPKTRAPQAAPTTPPRVERNPPAKSDSPPAAAKPRSADAPKPAPRAAAKAEPPIVRPAPKPAAAPARDSKPAAKPVAQPSKPASSDKGRSGSKKGNNR